MNKNKEIRGGCGLGKGIGIGRRYWVQCFWYWVEVWVEPGGGNKWVEMGHCGLKGHQLEGDGGNWQNESDSPERNFIEPRKRVTE